MGTQITPYAQSAPNLIYNLLFCDDLELFKENTKPPFEYPFSVLFSERSSVEDLQNVIDDDSTDSRLRILAFNLQRSRGANIESKELMAVIVELGLEDGLDVLAAFDDGTARYINHTGKILVWESPDETSNSIIGSLFETSSDIINQIGPWDGDRRPAPTTGNLRLTFLVSDGLYFGEGPIDVLFGDQMAGPALNSATQLLQYLNEKAEEK